MTGLPMSHHTHSSSQNTCKGWLTCLMSAIPPRRGETRESLAAQLSLYVDSLEDEAGLMTKQSLIEATRKFKWFPTVAELVEFFNERRVERSYARHFDTDMHPAKVNNLARLAMRDWYPAHGLLSLRGGVEWEKWALELACNAVRDGRIGGTFGRCGGGLGWTLDRTISAPIIPDNLFEEWRSS